ncbi:hypothetical protein niasHT_031719 [Heterodera trifolii]|uniref:Uncharacterized protein n=1 Tax=Heterodera trifolii TaxID=157864 RepID=A0ABD2IY56_9BILA
MQSLQNAGTAQKGHGLSPKLLKELLLFVPSTAWPSRRFLIINSLFFRLLTNGKSLVNWLTPYNIKVKGVKGSLPNEYYLLYVLCLSLDHNT